MWAGIGVDRPTHLRIPLMAVVKYFKGTVPIVYPDAFKPLKIMKMCDADRNAVYIFWDHRESSYVAYNRTSAEAGVYIKVRTNVTSCIVGFVNALGAAITTVCLAGDIRLLGDLEGKKKKKKKRTR